jgi:hypothetical protein
VAGFERRGTRGGGNISSSLKMKGGMGGVGVGEQKKH